MKSFISTLFQVVVAILVSAAEKIHDALFQYMSKTGAVLSAVQLPNGSIVAIAASYGEEFTISGISNANPGVATMLPTHGIAEGDVIELTSGWSRITDKIIRIGTVNTNDAQLEGIDTSLTTIFPAGAGAGTAREILSWTQLQQILESSTDGGEQQFLTYQFLEADAQKRIPTVKNPSGMTFQIADDPELAGYILAAAANDDRLPRAVRITLPSGALIFYNAYITLNKIPSLTVNELMAVEVTLSLLAEPTRYAS